ncbi:fatty acid elongase 3-like [Wolffia australiana]
MAKIATFLQKWLVGHPKIANFKWVQGQTQASSPNFLLFILISYLSLTVILRRLLPPRPAPLPSLRLLLRLVSPLHNAFILLLSLAMAVGCSISLNSQKPNFSWAFCFPPSTPAEGPVFFWAYIFFLSKIYELVDTLLILLSSDPRRLSFLHVYHHAIVLIMCRLWIVDRQSLMPIALVTNASVHVAMYGYYLCSSLGWRWPPRWKRSVTDCQIVQFCFSFAVSLVFLWFHFFRGGCSGMGAWVFNAVFNASLLFLFFDFHNSNYGSSEKKRDQRKTS